MRTAKDMLRRVVSDCADAMIAYRSAAQAAEDEEGRWLLEELALTRARALADLAPFVERVALPAHAAMPDLADGDEDRRRRTILRVESASLALLRTTIESAALDGLVRDALAPAHARITLARQGVHRSFGWARGSVGAPPWTLPASGTRAAAGEP